MPTALAIWRLDRIWELAQQLGLSDPECQKRATDTVDSLLRAAGHGDAIPAPPPPPALALDPSLDRIVVCRCGYKQKLAPGEHAPTVCPHCLSTAFGGPTRFL